MSKHDTDEYKLALEDAPPPAEPCAKCDDEGIYQDADTGAMQRCACGK